MSSRLFAALALVLSLCVAALPRRAAAACMTGCVVVDQLSVTSSPVPASGTTTIACGATGTSGTVTGLRVEVSGGTLPNGTGLQDLAVVEGVTASGTVAWSTPGAGSQSITCTATGRGSFGGNALTATATLAVEVVASSVPPPVIASLRASVPEGFPGEKIRLTAEVTGTGLSYAWTATGGAVAGSGAVAEWTVPEAAGSYVVTLAVTDGVGQRATLGTTVGSAWGLPASEVDAGGFTFPRRVAVDGAGQLYVTDPRQAVVRVLGPTGAEVRRFAAGESANGVAVWGGRVLVAESGTRTVRVYDGAGSEVGTLSAPGGFYQPTDVAVGSDGSAWVADGQGGAVHVFDAAGSYVRGLNVGALAVGVAPDVAGNRVYVSDALANVVRVFDLAGAAVGTIGAYGTGGGYLSEAGGVALGPDGNVYVGDAYQAAVHVFTPGGQFLAVVGSYGAGRGHLSIPLGVASGSGRLYVASTQTGRVEAYRLRGGTPPVVCPGDSDCDGMPDDWEVANGLDPLVKDGDLDADRDGLTNLEEWRLGTNPRKADTDGDGYTDGEEVAAGTNPLDPNDHRPSLVAGAPVTSGPGLVRLGATVVSRVACTVSWAQVEGPPVALRGATTLSPSFVGRMAVGYAFEGVATCGAQTSLPARLVATVENVAPRASAGRPRVVRADRMVGLGDGASWDGNGDLLRIGWEQTLGTPLTPLHHGEELFVWPREAGVYPFRLTATDPGGLSDAATTWVMALPGHEPGPTAVVHPEAQRALAGSEVRIEGRGSYPGDGELSWEQVAGPAVTIAPDGRAMRFVPPEPGRYAFELRVTARGMRSPAARAEVFASGATPLPRAEAEGPGPVKVGEPFELEAKGAGASGAIPKRWRQVSGPAAGLTDADRAVATGVAFEAGVYEFELVLGDGATEAPPARVGVEAQGDVPLPVARARALGHRRGAVLTGRESESGSGGALRYEWSQVGGPWVALEGARSEQAGFRTTERGRYAFELVVVDGGVRSRPARVEVEVRSPGNRHEDGWDGRGEDDR